MTLFELINLRKVRKAVLYLFCIVVSVWLQTMVLSRGGPAGVKPFFIPAMVVAVGMFEGGVWGGLLGLVTGLGCDLSYSDSTVLFTVLFTAFGFFSGLLTEYLINRRFIAWLLLAVLSLAVTAFCQLMPLWIFRGTAFRSLAGVALLQCLWSLPFAALSYFVVKFVAGRERRRLPG